MKNIRAWWRKIRRSTQGKSLRKRIAAVPRRPEMETLERREVLNGAPVILISLDGATPELVNQYLDSGVLDPSTGLGYLRSHGLQALRNETVSPSLTAPGHIAIATGSSAAHNDVMANSFHLLASPFNSNVSGFGAPIGGYDIHGPAHDHEHTSEPIWLALREAGKTVVAATWPGADGVDVRAPGLPATSPILQPASERTVDYTIPFGAFAGFGAQGHTLTAAQFSAAPAQTIADLTAAGKTSFSPVLQKVTPLETLANIGGQTYAIQVAALDTTNDSTTNYDTLVLFDNGHGGILGPFTAGPLGSGPAYEKVDADSSPFYFEGSANKAGAGYFVSHIAPDLSSVRLARYSANAIPRNLTVLGDVDDANANVGFWAPQPDFRIPERISPGFTNFPDAELEAMYQDQVVSFTDYQTRLALRALQQQPDADLAMFYMEQPDGSGHQFLLTDPRQPTKFTDPNSIGAGQDPAVVARYATYLQTAYQTASAAVQRIMDAVGYDMDGNLLANVIVVSDHGFAPFHTAVSMSNIVSQKVLPDVNAALTAAGPPTITSASLRAVTSGPSVNVYLNLVGRDPVGGTQITRQQYLVAQQAIAGSLQALADTNSTYTLGAASVSVFDKVYSRPTPADITDPNFGLGTSDVIGQDSGDVSALLTVGYNFDGIQGAGLVRKDDAPAAAPILSVPNFYGAHGYDPARPEMSAIFYAAGPDISRGTLPLVHNIDIAPTIAQLLGVTPADTIDGTAIKLSTPPLPNGVAAGDTTQTTTVLWTHSYQRGTVTFEVASDAGFHHVVATRTATVTNSFQPVKVTVAGLIPATDYFYRATDAVGATASGQFRTAAGVGSYNGLRFGVSGDWRGDLAPFPSVANADDKHLDFFVALGDTVYADVSSPDLPADQAVTITDYRVKNNEVYAARYGLNTLAELRASTSILATIDDHEVTNDFAGGAPIGSDPRFGGSPTDLINDSPLYENGLQAFQEYNPVRNEFYGATGDPRTAGERKLYRSNIFGQDAAVFTLDARSFRDAELVNANPTNPADVGRFLTQAFDPTRTMLGASQLADLKADLLAAQRNGVTWKFVMVPEPIQNLGPLGAADRFEGYAAERTEILKFVKANGIANVVFVAADIHGTLVNNLSYQDGPFGAQIPVNAFEITTGAVGYDAPFGPTVADLATQLGLLTPAQRAFYDSLSPDGKDQFLKGLINANLAPLGYDPIGLQGSGVQAELIVGDYIATQTYGWTEFVIDPDTQRLTVRTWGIAPYTQAELDANPDAITSRTPSVVSEFIVTPALQAAARLIGSELVINGAVGNDEIEISKKGNGSRATVVVEVNDRKIGEFPLSAMSRIYVNALAGNDEIEVASSLRLESILSGGSGNDEIHSGAGNNILLGGLGNDRLFAGSGWDVLIGGDGRDELHGQSDSDILIGGRTAYDRSNAALLSVLHEWSSDDWLLVKLVKLSYGIGVPALNDSTVLDDFVQDDLFGGGGFDWIFAHPKDRVRR